MLFVFILKKLFYYIKIYLNINNWYICFFNENNIKYHGIICYNTEFIILPGTKIRIKSKTTGKDYDNMVTNYMEYELKFKYNLDQSIIDSLKKQESDNNYKIYS